MVVWYSHLFKNFPADTVQDLSVCLFALSGISHFLPWASLVQLMGVAFSCVAAGPSRSFISVALPFYESSANVSVIPLWVGIWTVGVALAFRKTPPWAALLTVPAHLCAWFCRGAQQALLALPLLWALCQENRHRQTFSWAAPVFHLAQQTSYVLANTIQAPRSSSPHLPCGLRAEETTLNVNRHVSRPRLCSTGPARGGCRGPSGYTSPWGAAWWWVFTLASRRISTGKL